MSITLIGMDTAKSVFQVHGVNAAGKLQLKHKLRREEAVPFFEQQARCTVILEACGAGHHWARMLTQVGHKAKLLAPEAARPFGKKGKKNDAADAAALCGAASRPEVTFVPVKSPEQQGMLALHSVRSLLVKQQTMLANAMRGLAAEFGLVVARGVHRLDELEAQVQAAADIPAQAKQAFAELHGHSQAASKRIAGLETQIVAHARQDATARRLATIPGIGPITASLIRATVGDSIGSFKSSRHSPPGLAWCRGSIPQAARRGWGRSPRRATARSAGCWCSAPPPWCSGRDSGTAPPVPGCVGCWSGVWCGWRRWRWRIRWCASPGRR